MNSTRPYRPRLSLPFTIIPAESQLHLICGEDIRYTLNTGPLTAAIAELLQRCDGSRSVDQLLNGAAIPTGTTADREEIKDWIQRLIGERVLVEGPVDLAPRAARYQVSVTGEGIWAERIAAALGSRVDETTGRDLREDEPPTDELPEVAVLIQESLDFAAAMQFNRRCVEAQTTAWMWVSTGPIQRAYVSPVFLFAGGPCLSCLLRQFGRLSPVPQLYDVLAEHGRQGGEFSPGEFPETAANVLEQLVIWKLDQFQQPVPPDSVFRLHVLECDSFQLTTHRLLADPTCPECRRD